MVKINVIFEYLLVIGNLAYFCYVVITNGFATRIQCMSDWGIYLDYLQFLYLV